MPNEVEIANEVAVRLGDFMKAEGFSKYSRTQRAFVRNLGDKEDRVLINAFRWPSQPVWHVNFILCVRFKAVEALRASVNGLSAADSRQSCTVARPLETIYPKNREDFYWNFTALSDVQDAVPRMKDDITCFALPFFDSIPDVPGLASALASDAEPFEAPEMRASTLLLCLVVLGQNTEFHEWVPQLRRNLSDVQGGSFVAPFDAFVARLKSRLV